MAIKSGIAVQPILPFELTLASTMQAEADGYDSVWYPDHLMGWFSRSVWTPENSSLATVLPSPHIYMDPTAVIAVAGQSSSKVLLGTGVTDPIRRPPPELARTFVTLSHLTAGRAVLGIGAGERENTEPYGLDYSRRVARLEEALHVIRLFWETEGPVDFDGRFYRLRKAVMDLQPYQGVHPPIWIGAHGPRMLRLTGRLGDGWLPSYPMSPEVYAEKLDLIRKTAADAGRDPSSIEAGYQMYVVVTEDHEASHRLMELPLAKAMALVAPSEQWERVGKEHPFGARFEGLRDFVPEWYTKEELESAMGQFDASVIHDVLPHGTAEDVLKFIEPFVDAGLQHVVFANMAPIGGLEYVAAAQEGMKKVAAALR